MSSIDLIVVLVYLTGSIAIGLWAARSRASIGDYFLGGRDLPAGANLLSIIATETSAQTVISIPGIGARGNLAFPQLTFGRILVATWLPPTGLRQRHSPGPGDRLECPDLRPGHLEMVTMIYTWFGGFKAAVWTALIGSGVLVILQRTPFPALTVATGWLMSRFSAGSQPA